MKSKKSNAEIQTEAALDHISIMIQKQNVKVQDALYMAETVAKLLYKCEELRKSRDLWCARAHKAESKLKDGKN